MALTSTNIERIGEIRAKQESYFRSGATLDVRTRKANLVAFEKAVLKQYHQRTVGYGAYYFALELSGAASADATCGRDFVGMYRCAETFALCAGGVRCYRKDD